MKLFWFFVALIAGALLTGCAQMGTMQTDNSTVTKYGIGADGRTNSIVVDTRETRTRASGRAVISAASTFEGLNASQDGTRQGLKVDKASQKSDIDKVLDVFGKLAPLAAAMQGVPVAAPRPAVSPMLSAPDGWKWVLGTNGVPVVVPADDPSTPVLE
jgi:hypothetical protein